jgi:membrane protein DedA with SNARE-associated domain
MSRQKWWHDFFKTTDSLAFFLVLLITPAMSAILTALLGKILGALLPKELVLTLAGFLSTAIGILVYYLLVRLRKRA